MDFEKECLAALGDSSSSYWLRGAIIGCLERDIVDVLHDIGALQRLFLMKLEELKA
jgi:hypothetical protein